MVEKDYPVNVTKLPIDSYNGFFVSLRMRMLPVRGALRERGPYIRKLYDLMDMSVEDDGGDIEQDSFTLDMSFGAYSQYIGTGMEDASRNPKSLWELSDVEKSY